MKQPLTILLADDDPGHVALVERNLRRSGIVNGFLTFPDGQYVLDFLFGNGDAPRHVPERPYVLLLDIRMPRVDGIEVLRRVKADEELRRMPVIMLTTTDDPIEVAHCHELGCSNYIVKPVDSIRFVEMIQRLGLFLKIVEVPPLARD